MLFDSRQGRDGSPSHYIHIEYIVSVSHAGARLYIIHANEDPTIKTQKFMIEVFGLNIKHLILCFPLLLALSYYLLLWLSSNFQGKDAYYPSSIYLKMEW